MPLCHHAGRRACEWRSCDGSGAGACGQRADQLPCLISGRCPHRRAADRFTLGCHGKQIGTRVARNIPDSLELVNEQDMTVPCYQEEIRVRNITFPQIGLTSSM